MSNLSFAEVNLLLRADFEAGRLFWLPRPREVFPTLNSHSSWNSRYAGKEAFLFIDSAGYHVGSIHNRRYKAHRVLWLMATGQWPINQIDHINGDRADNRLANLRAVSNTDNARNKCRPATNTSGVVGVFWNKKCSKWRALIQANGQLKHLGLFDNFDDAVDARKIAEIELGYHPNHGRGA